MTTTNSTGESHEVAEPQIMCEACARMVPSGTEWHSLSEAQLSRSECMDHIRGPGYWVCTDCHDIIHEWMRRHPEAEHAAKEGFHRIFKGLAQIIEHSPRKYRRSAATDESGGGDESGADDESTR